MARWNELIPARLAEASDLSVPRGGARMGPRYDADAFGRFAEALARFLGTGPGHGQVGGFPEPGREQLFPAGHGQPPVRRQSAGSRWSRTSSTVTAPSSRPASSHTATLIRL